MRGTGHLQVIPKEGKDESCGTSKRQDLRDYSYGNQFLEKEGARCGERPLGLKVDLEREENGEPRVERIHEALVLEGGDWMLEVGVRKTEALVTELVKGGLAGGVDDVEHVERQS